MLPYYQMILTLVSLLSLVAITVCFWRALRTLRRLARATTPSDEPLIDHDLPTLSVCIPARNEMHALGECLERVLASRYPKLEILVLDDNSNDDTSILIKSFAHAGVRFIPGKALPAGWLGKNHAYAVMAEEASGDVLAFLDVDVAIAPTTFDDLIGLLKQRKLAMLSVLPYRHDRQRANALFGTLRYVLEVILTSEKRPASASALWMARRTLLATTGLEAFSASVKPEAHLAKRAHARGQYQALVGNSFLEVRFEKRYRSQVETAERVYFPMFGHRYGRAIVGLLFMMLVAFPTLGTVLSIARLPLLTATVSLGVNSLSLLLGIALLAVFESTARVRGLPFAALLWPWRIVQDTYLLLISILKYATHRVTWKGRNVSAPTRNTERLVIDE